MLEKNIYYVSLKSKEISNRENLTEAQYEISATKSEVHRLQSYLDRCKEFEEEESRSMLNPFTFTEDRAAHREYNENLNTDRKSTRLNSSHVAISYTVFCLKKKKRNQT